MNEQDRQTFQKNLNWGPHTYPSERVGRLFTHKTICWITELNNARINDWVNKWRNAYATLKIIKSFDPWEKSSWRQMLDKLSSMYTAAQLKFPVPLSGSYRTPNSVQTPTPTACVHTTHLIPCFPKPSELSSESLHTPESAHFADEKNHADPDWV